MQENGILNLCMYCQTAEVMLISAVIRYHSEMKQNLPQFLQKSSRFRWSQSSIRKVAKRLESMLMVFTSFDDVSTMVCSCTIDFGESYHETNAKYQDEGTIIQAIPQFSGCL